MTRANLAVGLDDLSIRATQMDNQFNAEEWRRMGSAERVQRCRLLAHEANALALSADPTMGGAYLDIAHNWEKLAEDIEAVAGRACLLVTSTNDVLR
jgi:hypothetical protein